MVSEFVQLYGRSSALMLVRDLLARYEENGELHSHRSPVVVFAGIRGIGKTALITELASRCDQQVPYARIDCETFRGDAAAMLTALAVGLNRKSGSYGTLAFPRFITGQIVVRASIDAIPGAGRAQVRKVLEETRQSAKVLKSVASDMLAGLAKALGGPHGVLTGLVLGELAKHGSDLLLAGLGSTRHGRRLILGKGQDWYADQDRALGRDALDVLVDLNQMAASPQKDGNGQAVAELLWAAFLADLRDDFQSRAAAAWTLNCAVLLDNADAAVGRDFLGELITARRLRAAHAAGEADPLTVVATSRGELADLVTQPGRQIPLLTAADNPELARAAMGNWYPVLLPDLTSDEVGNMVAALELPGGAQHSITAAVYAFTVGHPGSTRMLLDATAAAAGSAPDLQAVLAGLEPDALAPGRRPVQERLLCQLTTSLQHAPAGDPLAAGAVEDLVTCSAARDQDEAFRLAEQSRLLADWHPQVSGIFTAEFWRPAQPGRVATMHPLVRQLLLRRLAARTGPDLADVPAAPGGSRGHADWNRVHEWLQESSEKAGDTVCDLYHSLALGRVEHVARQLAGALRDVNLDPCAWIAILESVTAAPNREDHSQDLSAHLDALTSWACPDDAPLAPIGHLVASAWICADPLRTGQRAALLVGMGEDALEIARSAGSGKRSLRTLAETYRKAARAN
jgi:hypothetical protein